MIRFQRIASMAVLALVCVVSSSLPATGQFLTRSLTPVGNGPFSVAVGDFNGDGKQDVAVAAVYGPAVAVLLGHGDGTFQAPVNYAAGEAPETVLAADMNHDGKLDLVVASGTAVYVLIGNGDGTFQPALSSSLDSDPNFMAVGDFNGDHIPDVVVADSMVSVLLGNGDGTFRAPIDYRVSNQSVQGVAVGDFDGDGKLDVVALSDMVYILLGNGDGTLRQGETYRPVFGDLQSVTVADFRGVGRLDLAIGGLGETVSILLGKGDGTFHQPLYYTAPNPLEIVAADVNGDGKPDLVTAAESIIGGLGITGGVNVLYGNGDGTFQPVQSYLAANFSRSVAVADMNGDKMVDVIGSDWVNDNVSVLLNTGVVTFSPTTPVNFPFQLIGTESESQTVTLTNTGTTALKISSVTVTGPFDVKTSCVGSAAPGTGCVVKVRFLPAVIGDVKGGVTIKDSASGKPQVIDLTGSGTVVDLKPLRLDFPPQKVGTQSAPLTVTLTNQGTTTLKIQQPMLIYGNWKSFSETDTCGTQVAAGASCTITSTFTPNVTGQRVGSLHIADGGGGSPQTVILDGVGT